MAIGIVVAAVYELPNQASLTPTNDEASCDVED